MQYKTIVLELLEGRPQLRNRLQQEHRMLAAVEQYALELKASHEQWREQLARTRPASDPAQIASEAMELALNDLQELLPSESAAADETFSLDEAMSFLRRRSSNG